MKIYFAQTDNIILKNIALINHLYLDNEIEIIFKYKDLDALMLTVLGKLLLFMYLREIHGEKLLQLAFYRNAYGKPYLKNSQLSFSISHSNNISVCVCDTRNIGVDIEKIENIKSQPLENKLFHPDEINFLNKKDESLRKLFFYKIWTMKEAYSKYIGCGLNDSMRNVCFVLNDSIISSYHCNDIYINLKSFKIGTKYMGAVCSDKPINRLEVIKINTCFLVNYIKTSLNNI